MNKRYEIFTGSDSGHCCFEYTIVDTIQDKNGDSQFEHVCECFDIEKATIIRDALNKYNK